MARNLAANHRRKSAGVIMLNVVLGFTASTLAEVEGETAKQTPQYIEQRQTRAVIEEVMVTARRVEESLQDTPVSVAVFSRDDLRALGASEVSDIARFTPNLEIRKTPGSNDDLGLSIRGVSNAEPSLAIDPTVGVYVDGIYIARSSGMAFDIVDLQRIEVLRGPQGTLFGRNTIGGAINLITEKPVGEFAFRQEISYGRRGYQQIKSTLDTPRVGAVAAKVSYLQNSRDGVVSSIYGGDVGQYESRGARLAINWTPGDRFMADYALDWSRRESQPNTHQISHARPLFTDPAGAFYGGQYFESMAASASPSRLSKLPIRNTDDDDSHSDIDGHALTLEWGALSTMTIKSITSYRKWQSGSKDMDFGSFPAPADGSLCASPFPGDYDFVSGTCFNPVPAGELVPIFTVIGDSRQKQWTQELQFIGELLDGRVRYTAGLYYFEEQGLEINPFRLVISAPIAAEGVAQAFGIPSEFLVPQNRGNSLHIDLPHLRYSTDNQAYAAYGDFTYTALDNLDITLGFRYSVDKRKTTLTNELDEELKTVTESDSWNNFNPSLTVSYRLSEEINTYAKVVTGYRAGGYNIRATTESAFRVPFNEETVISYEAGWKADLLERTLRFNGALFYVDYKDQQVSQFEAGAGGAASTVVNAGKSVNWGLELEALWLATANLRVGLSYSYLQVDYKEFVTSKVDPVTSFPTNPGVNEDISGSASENMWAPKHSGALMAEYRFHSWAWGQLSARVDASYTDEMSFHPQLTRYDSSASHALLNARLTISEILAGRNGNLRLSAWGKNLTNEAYREFGIDFSVVGFAMNTYGELRSYGLDIIYEFNR